MNADLDDLELEVRRIPGVLVVGVRREGSLVVEVGVGPGVDPAAVAARVEVLARAHDASPKVRVEPVEPPPPAP